MAQPRFDPSQSVKFDLTRGAVSLEGSASNVVVPQQALLDLCRQAGDEALRDFGRKIGTEAGWRASGRLIDGPTRASIPAVVEHLGGNLALLGLGNLKVEQWGKALVFAVGNAPPGDHGAVLLGAVLEGALQRAMSRDLRMVVLDRDDQTVRLLATSPMTADKVRGWLAAGSSWGDALTKLNAGGDA